MAWRLAAWLLGSALLWACAATPQRPLGVPAASASSGVQASVRPSASSAPQASPTPRALGLRDFSAPAQGRMGEAVVLEGKLLVGNACAGESKLSLQVNEAKREVQVVAEQHIKATPAPGEEGPICPAVVSEIPASASFVPQNMGEYLVRVPVGFNRKAQGLILHVVAADAPASEPMPRLSPAPLPSADVSASSNPG